MDSKRGLNFARRNDDGWSVLQFQKDRESSRTSTTFAINVSTFSDQIDKTLAPLRRLPPVGAMPSQAACHLRRRLQELLPAGAGEKHVVDDSTDLAQLGATLRAALETFVIPFLDALATDRGLHAYWSMHVPRTGEQLEHVVLVRAFDTPDALARLAAHLRETADPAATKSQLRRATRSPRPAAEPPAHLGRLEVAPFSTAARAGRSQTHTAAGFADARSRATARASTRLPECRCCTTTTPRRLRGSRTR